MRTRSRTLRSWSTVAMFAALLVAGSWAGAGEASAATRHGKDRSGSSVSRQAVPRASGSVRVPSTRHRGRSHGSYGYRSGYHIGISYGSPYFYGRYGYGYYPYYPHYWYYWPAYYPYPYPRRVYPRGELGAFDLNVKPKKAQVFVDGTYAGTAGKLDGFPSYLWVEPGRHELVFYLPGYQTVARQVTALGATVIDVGLRLEPGESRPPEEVMTYRAPARPEPREIARREPAPERPLPRREPAAEAPPVARESMDLRGEPGRFQVSVQPPDASVYLDGRFLGTGGELARLHAGLMVDPGEHQVEIVRPGYVSRTVDFTVEAGEEVEIRIDLEPVAGF